MYTYVYMYILLGVALAWAESYLCVLLHLHKYTRISSSLPALPKRQKTTFDKRSGRGVVSSCWKQVTGGQYNSDEIAPRTQKKQNCLQGMSLNKWHLLIRQTSLLLSLCYVSNGQMTFQENLKEIIKHMQENF